MHYIFIIGYRRDQQTTTYDLFMVHSDSWFGFRSGGAGACISRGAEDNCWVQKENAAETSIHLYLFHPLKFCLVYVL